MSQVTQIFKFIFIFFLFTALTACSPTKKNPYYAKRVKGSHVNASQLGRNKYYFSKSYQKKLNKNYRKK